ncbi:MAG TPA: sodium-dependent bicarbonate transport family permease, partial [Pirellulaceae bacterium]|nr:sodium-dependent bicarbonate transport family permease [Pirellulaceae bacterium]
HEVFLNPGIYLLFAGIVIGFVSRLQGARVIVANDHVFVELFQGILCLFLLEMGITASKKLKDLRTGGWRFALFALLAPNIFATFGMLMARGYSLATGMPLEIGTYVLFAVLCGAASYIALPAVQRMAIPEASPTLPLAASLGITFSYNVTVGIPVYILLANLIAGAA